MTNPDNAGLDTPISALQPIVDHFAQGGLTRTDIWMLSSLVATEVALPESHRSMIFPLHWMGRKTCEMVHDDDDENDDDDDENDDDCGLDANNGSILTVGCTPPMMLRGPHVELCHGNSGTQTVLDFFATEFGFDAQQVTAIMGAHSVGRMSSQNSGFDGQWDLSPDTLDVGYMIDLDRGPDFILQTKANGIQQWEAHSVDTDTTLVMMQADIALVRNIPDEPDDTTCSFRGGDNPCSTDTPFVAHVQRYVTSTDTFLSDFRDVMNLLIDHGHDKTGLGDCPEGSLCSFGFEPPNFARPEGFVIEEANR